MTLHLASQKLFMAGVQTSTMASGSIVTGGASQKVTFGAYDCLGTFEVVANTTQIVLSKIPQGYAHLEIIYNARSTRGTYGYDALYMRLNDDNGNNYNYDFLRSTTSALASSMGANDSNFYMDWGLGTSVDKYPATGVIHIFDYSNLKKMKPIKAMYGVDLNGSTIAGAAGRHNFQGGAWRQLDAVTKITFNSYNSYDFVAGSTFTVNGIR